MSERIVLTSHSHILNGNMLSVLGLKGHRIKLDDRLMLSIDVCLFIHN